jgi:hypothetical protein
VAQEERPGDHEKSGGDVEGTRAAYQVVISTPQPRVSDRALVSMLEEHRFEIERGLTRRAVQRFGPAYFVQVGESFPEASIRVAVRLGVRYPVRAAAAIVDELRRFAGEIELAIADALDPYFPQPAVVAAELDEASVTDTSESQQPATPWDRIAPILAVIGTGIGVLGFVTFVGGAIESARFHATGLPQEEALSVVPTQDLVVVGARTLVPALVFGILASSLYLITQILAGRREQRLPDPSQRTRVERHGDAARAISLAVLVGVFEVLAFFSTLEAPGALQYVGFIFLGSLMVALTYSIARVTDKFAYLTMTVFLALSLFLGGVKYVRAWSTNGLRAAAIVRENKKATIGFFVAETGSRVYLARLDLRALEQGRIEQSSARLIGIEKDQVTDLAVGPPKAPEDAVTQARALADELCSIEIPAKRPPPSKTAKPVRSKSKRVKAQNCWSAPPGDKPRVGDAVRRSRGP